MCTLIHLCTKIIRRLSFRCQIFQWWMQHLLYQDEFIPRGLDSTGRDEFGLEYGGIEFGCQTTHRINEIIQNGIEIQLKQKVPCGLEDGFRVLR